MSHFENNLEPLLQQAHAFAREYACKIGEPVRISDAEYALFIAAQKEQFNESFNKNKFIICANLKADNLEHCLAMEDVMGWASDLSVGDYFQKIHPDYLSPYLTWSMAVYELSTELGELLKPFEQAYQIQVPLQHANGTYFWCAMQGFPLRFDANKNMTAHCNIYQRMEEMNVYNHRLFQPFLIEKLEIMDDWNKRLAAKMKRYVLAPLNINELKTIKLGLEGKNIDEIATQMDISRNTVMKYNRHILQRGHEIGGMAFSKAETVGEYFSMMGWIK